MKLSLQVSVGKTAGKLIPITVPEFIIGRDPQCHLRPASPIISKRHCALVVRDGKAFIKDFESTNGTLVNDEKIAGEHELRNDDSLKIGPLEFVVKLEITKPTPVSRPTPVPAAKGSEDDDEVAAMLLAMQDEAGSAGAMSGGAVPDGSTVLDMPAVQLPPAEEAPVPNAGLSKTKKSDKPVPTMNTQTAAEAILAKYSRRKRT
jgi:pSer/pThr/pTyr-binding forkhead associated (FHA) protein